jgi:hypothetical protein
MIEELSNSEGRVYEEEDDTGGILLGNNNTV